MRTRASINDVGSVKGRAILEVRCTDLCAHGVVVAVLASLPVVLIEGTARAIDRVTVAKIICIDTGVASGTADFLRGVVALTTVAALESRSELPNVATDS